MNVSSPQFRGRRGAHKNQRAQQRRMARKAVYAEQEAERIRNTMKRKKLSSTTQLSEADRHFIQNHPKLFTEKEKDGLVFRKKADRIDIREEDRIEAHYDMLRS